MLYVSVRWSRFVEEIRRRSLGRIGRIVAMVSNCYSSRSFNGVVEAATVVLFKRAGCG
jgi:hypothetical protein